VGKIWKKNKMKEGLKINLLLESQSWNARRDSGVCLLLDDEWVFAEITFRFLVL